jgi:hypothetical protein
MQKLFGSATAATHEIPLWSLLYKHRETLNIQKDFPQTQEVQPWL